MVNRERGEVEIEIGDKTYIAVLDMDAMARLEDHWSGIYGKETFFSEIAEKAEKGSIKHSKSVLWASLLRHQPDVDESVIGTLTPRDMQTHSLKVFRAMQPDADDMAAAKGKGKARP